MGELTARGVMCICFVERRLDDGNYTTHHRRDVLVCGDISCVLSFIGESVNDLVLMEKVLTFTRCSANSGETFGKYTTEFQMNLL